MAHAQKPDLVFQRNGGVHLNRRGSQFSRLLAVEECGSAGRPWIDHVPRHSARVVATRSNHLFPLQFPSHASLCAITFRTASTTSSLAVPHCPLCRPTSAQAPGILDDRVIFRNVTPDVRWMTRRHCLRRILPASRAGVDFFVNIDFSVVVADVIIVTGSYAFGWEGKGRDCLHYVASGLDYGLMHTVGFSPAL